MNKSRVHVFISGRVQGVYFRQNTLQKAEELSVLGWVRNLRDGRVEAVFEGLSMEVTKLLQWCNKGPKNAIVDKVEVKYEDYTGEFKNFEIISTN
jgi:acylphosphatase